MAMSLKYCNLPVLFTLLLFSKVSPAQEKIIWQHQYDYVAIKTATQVDASPYSTDITLPLVTQALRSLKYQETDKSIFSLSKNQQPDLVFSQNTANALASRLYDGVSQLGADEVVVFSISEQAP
ncbi:hypothetical protein, partial [Alteromonas sp. C1M14]|uniref:hypothetical protein n=1 Tax=Alteromonas sp. C1M14 TaxID=2841567 RepID=UPI001C087A02